MGIVEANRTQDRLGKLKALADLLAAQMDQVEYSKDLPPLAKQYRETIREIEELDGRTNETDEVTALLEKRGADGKPGAVRKDRSKLSAN